MAVTSAAGRMQMRGDNGSFVHAAVASLSPVMVFSPSSCAILMILTGGWTCLGPGFSDVGTTFPIVKHCFT